MQKVCLDFEWSCNREVAKEASMGVIPMGGQIVDLPFCIHDKEMSLFKTVNLDKFYRQVNLEFFGLQGIATVYFNGQRIGTFAGEYNVVDVSKYAKSGQNVVRIDLQNLYGFAGITGGVNLLCAVSNLQIANNGVFVVTRFCSPSVAFLSCSVELNLNLFDKKSNSLLQVESTNFESPVLCEILLEIFNHKGKRVSRRIKNLRMRRDVNAEFKKIKLNKPLLYNEQTPNLYKATVSLIVEGVVVDSSSAIFGIRTFSVRKKKLALNNRLLWLNGVKCEISSQASSVASTSILEHKRLKKIKSYGFNALSVQGLPQPAFLDACDRAGVLVMVELVNGFFGDKSFESFVFDRENQSILTNYVRLLRNHPSVIIYSIADCNPYTYGRSDGIKFATKVVEIIKSLDDTRPITGAITELVPNVDELQKYSSYDALSRTNDSKDLYKIAQMIGQESDIFRHATKEFVDLLDFVSYRDLSHRYKKDLELFENRKILGVGTTVDNLEKLSLGDLEFKANILGDFSDGKDFDMFDKLQPQYVYRQIMSGASFKSAIVTYQSAENSVVSQGKASWDYPSYQGENVVVDVFSSGDVVALYLNDQTVGRSLASRLDNKKARFELEYNPGVLKAVSFLRGAEHCECQISSVGFPHAINLVLDKKQINLYDRRDLIFVEVCIVDQQSNVVDFAVRDVLFSVSEECKIVSYFNSNPKFVYREFDSNEILLPVYDGKAQVILKGVSEGRATLVASSEGLRTSRQKISIKTQVAKPSRSAPKF